MRAIFSMFQVHRIRGNLATSVTPPPLSPGKTPVNRYSQENDFLIFWNEIHHIYEAFLFS